MRIQRSPAVVSTFKGSMNETDIQEVPVDKSVQKKSETGKVVSKRPAKSSVGHFIFTFIRQFLGIADKATTFHFANRSQQIEIINETQSVDGTITRQVRLEKKRQLFLGFKRDEE